MIKSNQTSVIAADVESQDPTNLKPWYKNSRVILAVVLVALVLTLCIALPFIIKPNAPTVEDPKHVAAKKNYSATKIQSLARTRAQQKKYSGAQASATKIQTVARTRAQQKKYNNAKAKIQSLARLSPNSLSGHPIIEQPMTYSDWTGVLKEVAAQARTLVHEASLAASEGVARHASATKIQSQAEQLSPTSNLQIVRRAKGVTLQAKGENKGLKIGDDKTTVPAGIAQASVARVGQRSAEDASSDDESEEWQFVQEQRSAQKKAAIALAEEAAIAVQAKPNAEAEAKTAASISLRPSYGARFESWTAAKKAADSKRKTTTV